MLPVIALVGRPNVGKSTLFNCLTRSRDAIVADLPGLTRDRQYGEGVVDDYAFVAIDTGGIGEQEAEIDEFMAQQACLAIEEADIVFFLVDARAGLTSGDQQVAQQLRRDNKKVVLVVNKTDGLEPHGACADFYTLGLPIVVPIAASHRRGVTQLIRTAFDDIPLPEPEVETAQIKESIKLAIVGRPNVGKSTLVNRILGEERTVVFDMPGTTRDSIFIPLEKDNKNYTLIDTAGVRKRGRVSAGVEQYSVIKALKAIEMAQVVIILIDAQEGLTEQDLHLLGFCMDAGRAIVLAVNKWDGLSIEEREINRDKLNRRLHFIDYAEVFFISGLHGSGVGDLLPAVERAYQSSMKQLTTPEVNAVLGQALKSHPPPLVRGRRVKLRYAHIGGHNPPLIVIHGNQTKSVPDSYKRYLMNTFRRHFEMVGTPIRLVFKSSDNPFKGLRNKLTPRQERKRGRIIKRRKKGG